MGSEIAIIRAIKERNDRFKSIRSNNVKNFLIDLCVRHNLYYRIIQQYQIRIENDLDIYTPNCRFHYLKSQRRGRVYNLKKQIEEIAEAKK